MKVVETCPAFCDGVLFLYALADACLAASVLRASGKALKQEKRMGDVVKQFLASDAFADVDAYRNSVLKSVGVFLALLLVQ
jgi:hypothetical protein